MMILTRKQAITEHCKMWNQIAGEYKKGSTEDAYILKLRYTHILGITLKNNCFCCKYDDQENGDCKQCPIDFGEGKYSCEENRESPYKKLRDYCIKTFVLGKTRDSEYMAELALKIANLPERKLTEENGK